MQLRLQVKLEWEPRITSIVKKLIYILFSELEVREQKLSKSEGIETLRIKSTGNEVDWNWARISTMFFFTLCPAAGFLYWSGDLECELSSQGEGEGLMT